MLKPWELKPWEWKPWKWSLESIYKSVKKHWRNTIMTDEDIAAYSLLPVRGKVVLDLGAYNGDSAEFFLRRGAKGVICIEPNKRVAAAIYLRFYKTSYIERVEVRARKVMAQDLLNDDYDVIKCDIEGYETPLLDFFKKPTIIEAHNHWIREQLEKRGFEVVGEVDPMLGLCLMKNFTTTLRERADVDML